jgi:uncharacterized membrane protein YfcA
MDAVVAGLVLVISFLAGFFGSLLGLGGGFIVVPMLTLGLGFDIKIAISASLIGIIANSSTTTVNYLKVGFTNVNLGLVLAIATSTGAIIGALIAVFIQREALTFLFGMVLIIIAVFMKTQLTRGNASHRSGIERENKQILDLSGSYQDKTTGKNINYKVEHLGRGMGGGFLAGNISGILGVGGGVVNVPVMNLWMKVPLKAAIATSSFIIGITAVAGAFVYYSFGLVSSLLTVLVVFGVFVGASLGSRLVPRIRTDILRNIFVVFAIIIAILMFARAFGLYPT